MAQTPMTLLGGLWLKQSQKVGAYMTGPLTQATRLFVFRNPKKPKGSTGDEPDYFIYIGSNSQPKTAPEPAAQKSQESEPPADPDGHYT